MTPSEVLRRAKAIHENGEPALLSVGLATGYHQIAGRAAFYYWRKADRDFDHAIALAEAEE